MFRYLYPGTLKLLPFSNDSIYVYPHERDTKSYDSLMKAFDEYGHSQIRSLRKKKSKKPLAMIV